MDTDPFSFSCSINSRIVIFGNSCASDGIVSSWEFSSLIFFVIDSQKRISESISSSVILRGNTSSKDNCGWLSSLLEDSIFLLQPSDVVDWLCFSLHFRASSAYTFRSFCSIALAILCRSLRLRFGVSIAAEASLLLFSATLFPTSP